LASAYRRGQCLAGEGTGSAFCLAGAGTCHFIPDGGTAATDDCPSYTPAQYGFEKGHTSSIHAASASLMGTSWLALLARTHELIDAS
jgi:hypothetical protein